VPDDFVMSLGGQGMQARGECFILLVGNQVDLGAEELSDQRAGIVEAFEFLAGKLREGCFSPISDELDGVDEVFFSERSRWKRSLSGRSLISICLARALR
jgi:hypothetical protein